MVGLADCNNFFVSCERSVDPALEGKAVVVLSNNDGCVVARSNEAKRLGIRMGQPAFEIRFLVDSGRVIALSGNHLLYRDISLRIHDLFRRYVPSAIDYSVDEAFLDVNGIPVSQLPVIGEAIHRACLNEMHIPVTIGFAPTKTLAKVITELSKKRGHPVGIFPSSDDALPVLKLMPVGDLWGIGRRIAKQLYQCGVYTMADFAARDVMWVRRKFGVNGERSWRELHGESCITLGHVDRRLQDTISETRTFPEDIGDYDYLRARIVIYASDCARKLRAMRGLCGGIGVFLRGNPFKSDRSLIKPTAHIHLPEPTSITSRITATAVNLLDTIFIPSMEYKRAGVWLSDIVADVPSTPSLFEPPREKNEAMKRLMSTIDNINGSVGHNLELAARLVEVRRGHNDGYSSSFQAPKK